MKIETFLLTNPWLSGMKALTAIMALLMFVAATPEIARAQSCQNVLQSHVNWAAQSAEGPGNYSLGFVMVSNRIFQKATYAEGSLSFKQTGFGGTVTQYFNDKRWYYDTLADAPFDPKKTAKLNVWLDANTGKATIGNFTVDLKCDQAGVLYGVNKAQGSFFVPTMFVISLNRNFAPIPK